MLDIIVYDRIERKNELEREHPVRMSPQRSLEHTLNMMDFLATFSNNKNRVNDSDIEWINLEINPNDIK